MAGGGSDEDNPVPVNVVALIDILMCLLLFYMCAAKFAAVEGRMDAWLPLDKGAQAGPAQPKILDEVRIKMTWDKEKEITVKRFGNRPVENDKDLEDSLVKQYAAVKGSKSGTELPAVVLEVNGDVPWKDVVDVMDIAHRNEIDKIEFSFTADAAGKDLGK